MISLTLFAATLAAPVAMVGCASGSFYDPYNQAYLQWNPGEEGYYRQWEGETHRNHMGFNRRSAGEQRAYWGWRHR
jgi:hypothetical protein